MMLIISLIFLGSRPVFANEEFIRAALDNDVNRARQLLDEGADIDYLNAKEDMTALMCSSRLGNLEMARFLARRKAEMGRTDDFETALHMAILYGRSKTADMLWEMNERKMSRCQMGNLLHMCSEKKSPEMLDFMGKILKAGVSSEELNETDEFHDTPMLEALGNGNAEAVGLMIQAGCDIHAKEKNTEWTALHFASGREGFTTLVEFFLEAGVELEAKDHRGETALHAALRTGPERTVELLIEANADVRINAYEGSSALDLAASRKGFEKIMKKLLEKGVDARKKQKNGNTCLHEALLRGSLKAVELLLPYDVDFKAINKRGESALHLAASKGDAAHVVEFLVGKGLDINAKDVLGDAPLHKALKGRKIQMVRKLLELGADFRQSGHNRVSPLALASGWEEFYDVAKMILESGFDPNARDGDGKTALHAAACECCVQIIDLLLSFGGNINATSNRGSTPLTAAVAASIYSEYKSRRETIRFVIDRGGQIGSSISPASFFIRMAFTNPKRAEIFLEEYPNTEFYDEMLEEFVKYGTFGVPVMKLKLPIFADTELRVQGILPIIINNGANITNGKETLRLFAKEILRGKIPTKKKPTWPETFPQFLATAIKKRIQYRGDDGNIAELYSKKEIFALYRSVKKWYEEITGAEGEGECRAFDVALKERQLRYYDEIIMELTKGTYVSALPNDLARDVINNFHCHFWREILKFSRILSLVEATAAETIVNNNGDFIKPQLITLHFKNIIL